MRQPRSHRCTQLRVAEQQVLRGSGHSTPRTTPNNRIELTDRQRRTGSTVLQDGPPFTKTLGAQSES